MMIVILLIHDFFNFFDVINVIKETEEFLSKLVVSKTIYAKIDRPAGIVCFSAPRNANQVLNDWSSNINSLLGLIEKTCHLITKEEMLHNIARVK